MLFWTPSTLLDIETVMGLKCCKIAHRHHPWHRCPAAFAAPFYCIYKVYLQNWYPEPLPLKLLQELVQMKCWVLWHGPPLTTASGAPSVMPVCLPCRMAVYNMRFTAATASPSCGAREKLHRATPSPRQHAASKRKGPIMPYGQECCCECTDQWSPAAVRKSRGAALGSRPWRRRRAAPAAPACPPSVAALQTVLRPQRPRRPPQPAAALQRRPAAL